MNIDETCNFLTSDHFIIYSMDAILHKFKKFVINGNYIRLIRLAEFNIYNLIDNYNNCTEIKKYSQYTITKSEQVVNNINYLMRLDKLSSNTKNFKSWLKHIDFEDDLMYEHLYDKWITLNKNITLWFIGLDCINKQIILSNYKQL